MLFNLLNQSGLITFEGDAVKGPCHAPFSEARRADVCGMQVILSYTRLVRQACVFSTV